ncbi:MAG: tandem-95 repeat protein, partial [Planctomycetales bacterium]|nr:tandem-95 repeat protein [Planctomycetales bacterium]
PSSGTVVLSSNGAFEYQPNANFSGTDTFTYTVSDGFAQSGEVLVVLTIRPVNDAPEAADDSYTIDSDQTLTVSVGDGVLANDSDQENNPITAILDQAPANGSVTLNADGSFTYTPNALFSGTDFFTYVADDGTSSSEPATVTIDVTSPTGQLVTVAAAQDATLYEDLTGSQANGAGEFLFVGSNSDGDRRRALVEFDLAGADIPPGALITNVTLTMNMSQTASGSNLVSLHAVDASWSEGTSDATGDEQFGAISTINDATWIHRQFNTTNWTTAGGDFGSSASASTLVDAVGSYTWSSPQMITDVEGWLSDPSSNFGWLLMGVEVANSYKRFDSSENASTANRPVLRIQWDSTFVASAEAEPEDFPSEIVAAALPDTISDSSSMPLLESAGETLAASIDLEPETAIPVDMADLMFMRIDDASESYSVLLKALASNRSTATDDIFTAEDTNWRPL